MLASNTSTEVGEAMPRLFILSPISYAGVGGCKGMDVTCVFPGFHDLGELEIWDCIGINVAFAISIRSAA